MVGDFPNERFFESRTRREAQLFVDLKDFTKRTAAIKEQAMGDFLKRYFYEPIFELAAKLKGSSDHVLSVVNILGDAVAFRGEVSAVVALALGIRRILAKAEDELTDSVPDLLGGSANLSEVDEEGCSERLAKSIGLGLEAGVYISFGAAAERVDLAHPTLGPWSVSIGERLNEAARGTARSGLVKAERDAAVAKARAERKSPRLASPFQVRVGRSFQLQLPPPQVDAMESAIHRLDKNAVTTSVRDIAQWLHEIASEAIDGQEGALPGCIARLEDLYNAGCALSGTALEAFEKAAQRTFAFKRIELYHSELPAEFHRVHLLDFDPERLIVVTDLGSGAPAYLLRYAGKAVFKGFEAQGGIDIWELLLPDLAFGRDLLAVLQTPACEPTHPPAAGEARG
jgi:hypothetical protein